MVRNNGIGQNPKLVYSYGSIGRIPQAIVCLNTDSIPFLGDNGVLRHSYHPSYLTLSAPDVFRKKQHTRDNDTWYSNENGGSVALNRSLG